MSINFKKTTPGIEMYPHYNSMINASASNSGVFGGSIIVNGTGTEYEFRSLESELNTRIFGVEEDWRIKQKERFTLAILYDSVSYPLGEKADAMKELFRVSDNVYDSNNDRRGMISGRMLHRAYMMSALRSFAWTLYNYCLDSGKTPNSVTINELNELIEFIESCNWLNYNKECMSGICCGSDIHNYFLPDALPDEVKNQFLASKETIATEQKRMNENPGYNPMLPEVCSLNKLRADLAYIYPAILTIYKSLKKNRNYDKPLEGNAADILFAWCSLAYSADGPFFVEDGPTHCILTNRTEIDLDSDYESVLFDGKVDTKELTVRDLFPITAPIEGTAYEGRNARIENVKAGDKLIFKADYNNKYYSPVAIEVFNSNNGSLGYIQSSINYRTGISRLEIIARFKDELVATVESVTPLSARSKNAKYALMDIKFSPSEKKSVTKSAPKSAFSAPKVTSTDKKASDKKADSTQSPEQIAVVNDTWEVTIPSGYIYCTDKSIIREHRDIIIMQDKKKNNFRNPFEATESFTSMVREVEDAALRGPAYADLMFEGNNPITVIRETNDLYVAYTYLRTDRSVENGKTNTLDIFQLLVAAGKYISTMNIFFNNSKKSHDDQQLLVDKVARSIRIKGGSKSSLYDIDDNDIIKLKNHNSEVMDKVIEKLEASKQDGNNLTPEVTEEIKDILSEIDETAITDEALVQFNEIKSQLEYAQEVSSRTQVIQDKIEAEKQSCDEKRRKLMKERDNLENPNDVTMYFSLLIEKSIGKIRRAKNDFYDLYSEDFPELSKTELIELRKATIPKMDDKAFVKACEEAFKQLSFEYRYEMFMLDKFNMECKKGKPLEAKQLALKLCANYFSEDELTECSRLLDDKIADIRKSLEESLSAGDPAWINFETASGALRFNADENYESENVFQYKSIDNYGCCHIVLYKGIYSLPINNLFPWFWGVSITDIYDAANKNPVKEMTDSVYEEGEYLAEEATELAYKKYGNGKTPPPKEESHELSASEKFDIEKLKDLIKLAEENEKLLSDLYANASKDGIIGSSSTASQNTSSTSSASTNNNDSSGCCYVATCAYGSYDCPQVWTLRRFRDYVLAKTWYGRLFITLYYFFAPYLVKFFGETEWFKSAWRKYLDKKVERLNNEGFENTPYQDIDW